MKTQLRIQKLKEKVWEASDDWTGSLYLKKKNKKKMQAVTFSNLMLSGTEFVLFVAIPYPAGGIMEVESLK